jgi:Xaa-Pro aminopeptidase
MNEQRTERRRRLIVAVNGGLVVLAGYEAMQQSADMEAPFLQEASFWWLTGIEEPGWKVIIDGIRKRTCLVRPTMSDTHRTFNGGLSDSEALQVSGANEVIGDEEFESYLRQLRRTHSVAYDNYDRSPGYDFVVNPAQKELHETLGRIFENVQNCIGKLNELRAIKQPDEITAIEKAVTLTVDAFAHVRKELSSYKAEYEIEAEFTHFFRRKNAAHAYAPIVASGSHACTLHYGKNESKFASRNLVLIDIGARVDGYAADITRTYAVNPTKRQQTVHAAVEQAHHAIIALIKPGLLVSDYIASVDTIMKDTLMSIGLLKDMDDNQTYRKYFPHAVSHGLGIDVHDSLGAPRYLKEGMVLTVEPGIYIPEEGIGIRIEDDILVTAKGHKNLSGRLSTSL